MTLKEKQIIAESQGFKVGNWYKVLSGFGKGKVFCATNVDILNSRVVGEITIGANFYSINPRFDEVEKIKKPNFDR